MTDSPLFTRQDICRLAGVSDEVATFWLRRGLLRHEPGVVGKGSHRKFNTDQAAIACLLRAARDAGLNIAALSAIAGAAQRALDKLVSYDLDTRWGWDILTEAGWVRHENRSADLSFMRKQGVQEKDIERFNKQADSLSIISLDEEDEMRLGLSIVARSGDLTARKDDTGNWLLYPGVSEVADLTSDYDFQIVFNFDRIAKHVPKRFEREPRL